MRYVYMLLGFALAGLIGVIAIRPALAAQVSCALTIACDGGNNSSTGPGVQGDSLKGNGVVGNTRSTGNTVGVAGNDATTSVQSNVGVRGLSNFGTGVYGASNSTSSIHSGVKGFTPSSNASAVWGSNAGGGYGVLGDSKSGVGVLGDSQSPMSGRGVLGQGYWGVQAEGAQYGLYAEASGGMGTFSSGATYGLYATATNGGQDGVYANGGVTGLYARGASFGVTGYGDSIGVTGHAQGGSGTAVLAETDGSNSLLFVGEQFGASSPAFTVDASGNGYYKGQVTATAFVTHSAPAVAQSTSNGSRVTTFAAQQTAPSVEHVGEENLVSGTAVVRFNPTFAATIARGTYMVFITPQGQTQGSLYVTQKGPAGFIVRENQQGRSNVAFDYRVVARPFSTTVHTDPGVPRVWPRGPAVQHPPVVRKPHNPHFRIPAMLTPPR